jgi:beta-N-acetylglucosaminidase
MQQLDLFPNALDVQVGGSHYKKLKIQPAQYNHANGIGFLAGNVIKYATRYADKGGADDIRKAIHYCQLILELEYNESGS